MNSQEPNINSKNNKFARYLYLIFSSLIFLIIIVLVKDHLKERLKRNIINEALEEYRRDTIKTVANIKSDTVYNNYYNINYTDGLSFGCNLTEWNRYIALLAKNNIISDVDEDIVLDERPSSYNIKSYKGEFYPQGSLKRRINGVFIQTYIENDTTHQILVNSIPQTEPILVEVKNYYSLYNKVSEYISFPNVVLEYLHDNGFYLIAGVDANDINFTTPTESDMRKSDNEIQQIITAQINEISKNRNINENQWYKKYKEGLVEFTEDKEYKSLYENESLYAKLHTTKIEYYTVFRNYGEYSKFLNSSYNFIIGLYVTPKSFTQINKESYYTEEQKIKIREENYKIEKEKNTNALIDKALRK